MKNNEQRILPTMIKSYSILLAPELILCTVASVLVLLGCSMKAASRRFAPMLAFFALLLVFAVQILVQSGVQSGDTGGDHTLTDPSDTLRIFHFAHYIKLLAAGIGAMLILLAWPTNPEATGNSALNVGQETGEFFGLMLF